EERTVPEEMDLAVHLNINRDHARHLIGGSRLGPERAPEVHRSTAFGIDWGPIRVGTLDRLGHRAILRQGLDKDLRKAAAKVDTRGALRQVRVLQRTERYDLRAMLLEQFQVLRVIEVKRVVIGDGEANPRARVRLAEEDLFGDQRHQLRLVRNEKQQ